MREKIYIKYDDPSIDKIEKINVGDWIDLRTAEKTHMERGDFKMLSLGVAMQLPKGYEALVVPRSSTFKKWGLILVNSVGVIDESYCGEDDVWRFPAYATRMIDIPKNERICQFRIIRHQPEIEFIEVEELKNQNRGGFGSTDVMEDDRK